MSNRLLHRIFNRARIDDRLVNELVGLSKGVIADGILTKVEVEYIQTWLAANSAVSSNPVISMLMTRINDALSDGFLDKEESKDLMDTLKRFSGGEVTLGEITKSTTLPLDKPLPTVEISGRRYCFTGTFAYGSRSDCEAAISAQGGIAGSLTQKTDYLVIGSYATDSWAHSTFGRKIEKACEMKNSGSGIFIISEDHWLSAGV